MNILPTTKITDLPSEIISKLGTYFDKESDVSTIHSTSKIFDTIAHNATVHIMTIGPDSMHKLQCIEQYMLYVRKRKPYVKKLFLRVYDIVTIQQYQLFKKIIEDGINEISNCINNFGFEIIEVSIMSEYIKHIVCLVGKLNIVIDYLNIICINRQHIGGVGDINNRLILPAKEKVKEVALCIYETNLDLLKDKELTGRLNKLFLKSYVWDNHIRDVINRLDEKTELYLYITTFNPKFTINNPKRMKRLHIDRFSPNFSTNDEEHIQLLNLYYKCNPFVNMKYFCIENIDVYGFESCDSTLISYDFIASLPISCIVYIRVNRNPFLIAFINRIRNRWGQENARKIVLIYSCRDTYIISKICQCFFPKEKVHIADSCDLFGSGINVSVENRYIPEEDVKFLVECKDLYYKLSESYQYCWYLLSRNI